MIYSVLAAFVLMLHLGLVPYTVFGGLITLRWRAAVWPHVAAVAWGLLIQLLPLTCPLTWLENELRKAGGQDTYSGDFIGHYATQLLGADAVPTVQESLGIALLLVNVLTYGWFISRPAIADGLGASDHRAAQQRHAPDRGHNGSQVPTRGRRGA